jgi:hypothetical protein
MPVSLREYSIIAFACIHSFSVCPRRAPLCPILPSTEYTTAQRGLELSALLWPSAFEGWYRLAVCLLGVICVALVQGDHYVLSHTIPKVACEALHPNEDRQPSRKAFRSRHGTSESKHQERCRSKTWGTRRRNSHSVPS